MSWTTPRTWVAGEVVTAAIMNTHVRDNEAFLKQAKLEHPYGDNRHIEMGVASFGSLATGTQSSTTVTFTDAFASTPVVVATALPSGDNGSNTNATTAPAIAWVSAISTTQTTIYCRNTSNGSETLSVLWIAAGTD